MPNQLLKWLSYLFIATLLTACNSGGDDSSDFFSSSTTTPTTPDTNTGDLTAYVGFAGQVLMPPGQDSTYLNITTYDSAEGGARLPNVPLGFSTTGSATIDEAPASTNEQGDASFTVHDPVDENVILVTEGQGNYKGTVSIPLYFGASVISNVVSATTIPADGQTAAVIQVLAHDWAGLPIADLPVLLSFSPNSFAVPAIANGFTNASGQFSTEIVDTVAEQVIVTPIVGGFVADGLTLNFGITLDTPNTVHANILNADEFPILADGTSTADLEVIVRDEVGNPLIGVPISLSFPEDSFAVAIDAGGDTDASGVFTTQITNNIPQTTSVIVTAGGRSIDPIELVFGTAEAVTVPSSLDIITKADNVEPNGSAKASVVVVARDSGGAPIPNVPVSITSDSATAFMQLLGTSGTLYVTGNTGDLGYFEVNISNTVEETVTLNAISSGKDGSSVSGSQTVTFQSAQTPGGIAVSRVELEVLDNAQPASGEAAVILRGRILDSSGTPLADVDVSIIVDGGSANINLLNSGKSDASGRFFAELTDTRVESFKAKAVAGGVESVWQSVQFVAVPPPPGEEPGTPPTFIKLQASPLKQIANGEKAINLLASVRNEQNVPMEGVTVTIAAEGSNTAIFDNGQQKTGASGATNFKLTDSNIGNYTVRATAFVTDTSGKIVGKSITDVVDIAFISGDVDYANVQLEVSVLNDNQKANGTDAVNINVFSKDTGGRFVPDVPIILVMNSGKASATPASGNTNENGLFTTAITSAEAGEIVVTFAIDGTTIESNPVRINFLAETAVTPARIEIREVLNSPQVADGESKVTVVAVPIGDNGQPIADLSVELLLTPDDVVQVSDGGKKTSNAVGEARFTLTNTEAQSIKITPVAVSDAGNIVGDDTFVEFTSIPTVMATTLTLNVTNNNQEVGNEANLTVLAKDRATFPLNGVPIIFLVEPVNNPPDVTGSALFGDGGFKGETANSGTFTTTISNTQAGTFKVTALVENALQVRSNTVQVTFKPAAGISEPEVNEIRLLKSKQELPSEGSSEGILITTILKNSANNLVEGAVVSFRSDSGEIQPVQIEGGTAEAGVTDAAGRAQARLTTVGNPKERTITVTATVSTPTGDTKSVDIQIPVTGTKVGIQGPNAVTIGVPVEYIVTLKDSSDAGLANHVLNVSSDLNLGNTVNPASVTTNSLGQGTVSFTANNLGPNSKDVITVSSELAQQTATLEVNISDDKFVVTPVPLPPPFDKRCTSIDNLATVEPHCEIPLSKEQQFKVEWTKSGKQVPNTKIELSTTRGNLPSQTFTQLDGTATFTLSAANNAGPAIVSVRAQDGPSFQFEVEFVATNADSIFLQPSRAVISTNVPGSNTEQSEIIAIVRDANNNLVKGKRIDFVLTDITGGQLTRNTDVTDSFGRASTVYIAGSSSSGEKGVTIKGTVSDTPGVNSTTALTVAQRSLFISIGSGIDINRDGPRYSVPHSVLITDSNGTPVADAEITLGIYPKSYFKGIVVAGEDGNSIEIASICDNEDINRNGILDAGEDGNNNGKLDPGNVVTVDNLIVKTDQTGFVDFNVVYATQYANWVETEVIARAVVSGSEGSTTVQFVTTCAIADKESCPSSSPFVGLIDGIDQNGNPAKVPGFSCSDPF